MNQNISVEQEELENKSEDVKNSKFHLFRNKDKEKISGKSNSWIRKIGFKNLCILLVLGLMLIFLCCWDKTDTKGKKNKVIKQDGISQSLEANPIYGETKNDQEEYVSNLESRLKELLSKVKGVGKVDVMITLSESKELVALKDSPYTHDSVKEEDGQGGKRDSYKLTQEETTVMSSSTDGTTSPYVIKEIQPTIGGVVVTAEGAEDNKIKLDIVEAVEALFDVPIHKIKVLPMKS